MSPSSLIPVIRFGALGDMIVLTPLLRALRERHGRPCLVIGMGPWTRAVYQGNPDVRRVIVLSRHLPFACDAAWWSAVIALRRSRDVPVYVCEEHRANQVQRLLACAAVDRSRCRVRRDESEQQCDHEIERILRFAVIARDSLSPSRAFATPSLVVLEHERRERDEWLAARGWRGRPLVLVQPGNRRTMSSKRHRHRKMNRDDKAWPIESWRQLLGSIHERMPQAVLLLCGAPPEAAFLEEIRRASALECVRPAVLDLRSLFALCEAAHSMISIDSGPAHAAAALGLPLVVMFGGHSPERWLPRSPGTPVIRVGGPPECDRVDQIPVDAVLESWWQLSQRLTDAMAGEAVRSVAAALNSSSEHQAPNTASTGI